MNGSTQHRSCVVGDHEIWYGNGNNIRTGFDLRKQLGKTLCETVGRFVDHCTIILSGVPLAAIASQSDAIRAAGWVHTEVEPWTVFRQGERTVSVGISDAMMAHRHYGVLFDADTEPGPMAIMVDRYHRLTGHPWRGTPSMSALNAIRASWPRPDHQPLWRHRHPMAPGHSQGPLVWRRAPNRWEGSWGWVHQFDARSAYLAAANNAEVAWGGLHHVGVQPFDPTLPGYWLLQLPEPGPGVDLAAPPLYNPARAKDGRVWATTPTARLLHERWPDLWVLDSVTAASRGVRLFRSWAEGLRDARTAVEALPAGTVRGQLLTAVKRTYKDAAGGMQRAGSRIDRPDWGHTIIDLWRATLLRTVAEIHRTQGVWPLQVSTDSLWYADSTPDHRIMAQALGCRVQLGKYRHEGTVMLDEWAATKPARQPAAGDRPGTVRKVRRLEIVR